MTLFQLELYKKGIIKMKIIFLDYDGVVNNLIFQRPDGEPNFEDYDDKSFLKPFKLFR